MVWLWRTTKNINYYTRYEYVLDAYLFFRKGCSSSYTSQGRIQDIHLGVGAAQKIMCMHAHHEREARSLFRPGFSSRGFWCSLSCYLVLIFKQSDTKWDFFFFFFFFFFLNIVDLIVGGVVYISVMFLFVLFLSISGLNNFLFYFFHRTYLARIHETDGIPSLVT